MWYFLSGVTQRSTYLPPVALIQMSYMMSYMVGSITIQLISIPTHLSPCLPTCYVHSEHMQLSIIP